MTEIQYKNVSAKSFSELAEILRQRSKEEILERRNNPKGLNTYSYDAPKRKNKKNKPRKSI